MAESPERQPYDVGAVDADGNFRRAPVMEAVIAVLEGIPRPSTASEQGPEEIRKLAYSICLVAGFAGMNDHPNLRQHAGGTKGDLKEIQAAREQLAAMWEHFASMHLGARSAIEKTDQIGLKNFLKEVGRWWARANEAYLETEGGEHLPPPDTGQPKVVKAAIRPAALQAYERLAGRPAAMKDWNHGPFASYFKALLIALGLPPKGAASQASKAIKERKSTLGKAPL